MYVCLYVCGHTYLAHVREDLEGCLLDGGACVREGLNELEDDVGEELGDGFFLLAAGGFHDLWVCGCGCVGDHIKRVSEMKDVCIHVHVCVRVRVCVYTYIPLREDGQSLP